MKNRILSIITVVVILAGCQKQSEKEMANTSPDVKTQFEEADQKISEYLDLLDNPDANRDQQAKVLCSDYPQLYKTQYMPALLQLSPKDYTQEKLLKDLESATSYYKEKLNIKCT